MAIKILKKVIGAEVIVKVGYDAEGEEYIVHIVGNPDADYHTDNWLDAVGTAEVMAGNV